MTTPETPTARMIQMVKAAGALEVLTALREKLHAQGEEWAISAVSNRELKAIENAARCEGRSYGLRDAVEMIDEALARLG